MAPDPRAGTARPVPTTTLLAKNIQRLATFSELGELDDAAIYIKGNVIQWVGPMAELPADCQSADTVLDLSTHVVIPGLINTHHHMVQCLTRCVAQDELLFGWLAALYEAWKHLRAVDVYTSAKLAMAELIMSGCTCTSDHLYILPEGVKVEDTIRAAREIGMRFHPTRGAMSMGKSKGGMAPDEVCEEEDYVLKDMRRLIETYHDNSKYSMLRIGLAPCAPFNVTTDLMKAAAKIAREYKGVRLHTHLAENQEDVDYSLKTYGVRPGGYLRQVGWDKSDCWFAHCCMLDGPERKQFAEGGLGIAHCPSSNLRLGSGIAPVWQALRDGVNVGLGVDGSASNDAGNLLHEARLACFLQRAAGGCAAMSARDALKVAITNGAANLGRDDVGVIAPGYAADFAAFRTDTLAFTGAQIDVVAALIFCSPGADQVDYSVINGEVVVSEGKLQTIDVKALVKDADASSKFLCSFLPKKSAAS